MLYLKVKMHDVSGWLQIKEITFLWSVPDLIVDDAVVTHSLWHWQCGRRVNEVSVLYGGFVGFTTM